MAVTHLCPVVTHLSIWNHSLSWLDSRPREAMLEDWLARAEGKHSDLFPVTWQGFGERVSKERFARFQLLTLQKSKLPVEQ